MKTEIWTREELEDVRIDMRKIEDDYGQYNNRYSFLSGKEEALMWVLRG